MNDNVSRRVVMRSLVKGESQVPSSRPQGDIPEQVPEYAKDPAYRKEETGNREDLKLGPEPGQRDWTSTDVGYTSPNNMDSYYTVKKSNMSSFDSTLKETSRNLGILADQLSGCLAQFDRVLGSYQSVDILAMEIDLSDEERASLHSCKKHTEEMLEATKNSLDLTCRKAREVSTYLVGSKGYAPFLGKEVTKPFTPLYTAKVASFLGDLNQDLPEFAQEASQILSNLKIKE